MCLVRSLVVALAKVNMEPRHQNLIRLNSLEQKRRAPAPALHLEANVPTTYLCTLEDIPAFEHVIQHQVIVYSSTTAPLITIYMGENIWEEKRLFFIIVFQKLRGQSLLDTLNL